MKCKRPKQRRGQRDMSLAFHEWRFEVGEPDAGIRLDAFLAQRLRWRSRNRIQQAIERERVEIRSFKDARRAPIGRLRAALRLRRGQEVVVRLPAPQTEEEATEPRGEVVVVFEDEHLLAVDKPAASSVYPSRRHRAGSLIEMVHARHRERFGSGGYFPTPCHRLDRETTGLVLFAKCREVRREIGLKLEERAVRKRYLCLVEGIPRTNRGSVDLALGAVAGSAVEIKRGPRRDGLRAHSDWRLLEGLGRFALLELEPRTGRRHQLRVHMAALGHPIVGDKLYAGGDRLFLRSLADELTPEDTARLAMARQALHAWRLEFRLETAGREVRLEAPLPKDMAEFIESCRNQGVHAAAGG